MNNKSYVIFEKRLEELVLDGETIKSGKKSINNGDGIFVIFTDPF